MGELFDPGDLQRFLAGISVWQCCVWAGGGLEARVLQARTGALAHTLPFGSPPQCALECTIALHRAKPELMQSGTAFHLFLEAFVNWTRISRRHFARPNSLGRLDQGQ